MENKFEAPCKRKCAACHVDLPSGTMILADLNHVYCGRKCMDKGPQSMTKKGTAKPLRVMR